MNTALNRSMVALLTNKSGASVAQGDVVIVDSANASSFTTTTTVGFASGTIGVVLEPNGIASNAQGMVAVGGFVPKVNLDSSAGLGNLIKTQNVAKQATPHASPIATGDFGEVLGTGTAPAAFLWGHPSQGAALTNPMSHLGALIHGGTAGAPTELLVGAKYQTLGVNAGATDVEYGPLLNDWSGSIVWQQGATITKTVNYAYWARLGKLVVLLVAMTATSAGTGGSNIAVSGLPADAQLANSTSFWAVGSGIFEKSGGNRYEVVPAPSSASSFLFFSTNVGPALGGSPAVTVATGDLLSFVAAYAAS